MSEVIKGRLVAFDASDPDEVTIEVTVPRGTRAWLNGEVEIRIIDPHETSGNCDKEQEQ